MTVSNHVYRRRPAVLLKPAIPVSRMDGGLFAFKMRLRPHKRALSSQTLPAVTRTGHMWLSNGGSRLSAAHICSDGEWLLVQNGALERVFHNIYYQKFRAVQQPQGWRVVLHFFTGDCLTRPWDFKTGSAQTSNRYTGRGHFLFRPGLPLDTPLNVMTSPRRNPYS